MKNLKFKLRMKNDVLKSYIILHPSSFILFLVRRCLNLDECMFDATIKIFPEFSDR
jgi:hypothetical protein